MNAAFGRLLGDLVKQYGGNKQDLARAIGITPSVFSRLLNGGDGALPSIEVCLRLALVTGTPASQILRAAKHVAVDELIQQLYGPPTKFKHRQQHLSPIEEERLKQWRTLTAGEARALSIILGAMAGPPKQRRRIA